MRDVIIAGTTAAAPRAGPAVAFRDALSIDAVALVLLLLVSLIAGWPLLNAVDLDTGAGDWSAHAFRVESILAHGIAPWSSAWSGGMPLWEGYQVVPHLFTAALVQATGWESARAMTLSVGILLVVMRVGLYVACRGLGAPPWAALVGTLLAGALDTAWQPLANFSELWGLALAPIGILAAYRWAGRPGGLVVAAVLGLSVEVHPFLTVAGGMALVAAWAVAPRSRSNALLAGQGTALIAGAAVYWLPVVLSSAPRATEPYYASVAFSRLLFELGSRGFFAAWPVWMTAVAALLLLQARRAPAARFVLLLAALVLVLVGASLAPWCPERLRAVQLVRLVSLLPLLTAIAVALIVSWLGHSIDRPLRMSAVAVAGVLLLLRGWASPPPVLAAAGPPDPLMTAWLAGAVPADVGRVWADPVITARASAATRGAIGLGGNYAARDRSILHWPLQIYMRGEGSAIDRTAYLIAHQIEFALVPAGVRPAIDSLSGDSGSEAWRSVWSGDGYELLRAPWDAPAAWTVAGGRPAGLTPPDEAFHILESAYRRDRAVEEFARATLAGTPASVRRERGGAIIRVQLEGTGDARYVVVHENWDRGWRAAVDGEEIAVERFGPNLIGIALAGVSGDVTIHMERTWPPPDRAGLLVSILSLPSSIALASWSERRRRARRRAATSQRP